MSRYALGGTTPEQDRLDHLSRSVAALTDGLLSRIPVPPAAAVLDVGSGTGRLATDLALADRTRTVKAVDVDPALLRVAREHAAGRDAAVEFLAADAVRMPFDDDVFDLVTARFVLMHVRAPAAAVREMVRVCKPGGHLLFIEADWQGQLLYPDVEGVRRMQSLAVELARAAGINPYQGRELFGLCRQAGLVDVDVSAHVQVSTADDAALVTRKLTDRLDMSGRLTAGSGGHDLARARDAVAELLADPGLFATEFRVAAVARKPGVRG